MTIADFNALSVDEATEALRKCCGSSRWVACMLAARPFRDFEQFARAVAHGFTGLERADWLEAFSHHPRIGDRTLDAAAATQTQAWSAQEQSGTSGAAAETLAQLQAGNLAYEQRFGHVYLVCATGKTADELLAFLRARLANAPDDELHVCAGEQVKITAIRLGKLIEA